ncbi:MAG: hypothetical protein J0J01_06475 [Reyranella sp.]|uniref:bestrophin-like domain n=1 Tax=Reyranella sp. TaxID=1929291 RepID=UPI001AD01741|nr:hypothetical protein [Reyranella sp.]MBN9086535.1 hypothetical protein [Reyranella sp.]
MDTIFFRPVSVFLFTLVALLVAGWLGSWLRRRAGLDEKQQEDFSLILAATLTLLGLLIGFSFSMAANRYDQRKNLEEAEANAIGTEYLRADLLPAADADKVRDALKRYLDLRVRYYVADAEGARVLDPATARLQAELWTAVVGPAKRQPDPVVALVVAGMNDVINAQGYTQAAWWNHVPMSAVTLMGAIAFMCNVLIGYGAKAAPLHKRLLTILPLFVALAFALIFDIDTPRLGLIKIVPQNLVALQGSLK